MAVAVGVGVSRPGVRVAVGVGVAVAMAVAASTAAMAMTQGRSSNRRPARPVSRKPASGSARMSMMAICCSVLAWASCSVSPAVSELRVPGIAR